MENSERIKKLNFKLVILATVIWMFCIVAGLGWIINLTAGSKVSPEMRLIGNPFGNK